MPRTVRKKQGEIFLQTFIGNIGAVGFRPLELGAVPSCSLEAAFKRRACAPLEVGVCGGTDSWQLHTCWCCPTFNIALTIIIIFVLTFICVRVRARACVCTHTLLADNLQKLVLLPCDSLELNLGRRAWQRSCWTCPHILGFKNTRCLATVLKNPLAGCVDGHTDLPAKNIKLHTSFPWQLYSVPYTRGSLFTPSLGSVSGEHTWPRRKRHTKALH